MVFCNIPKNTHDIKFIKVTILILIDGFLQYKMKVFFDDLDESHNPYFNRWFSAIGIPINLEIETFVTILILIDGFLQYRK